MRNVSILLGLFVILNLACGSVPEPDGGGSSATSSTGDPNPATTCEGVGDGGAGDPCLTACDCCSADCRVLTALDGSMSGVCGGGCSATRRP